MKPGPLLATAVMLSLSGAQAQLTAVKQWSAIYDGPGHGVDLPSAALIDRHGYFYITGRSDGETSGQDIAIVRYSPTGQEVLTLRYNGPANSWDEANSLAVDDSGNIFVAGTSFVTGNRTEIVLLKYSPAGKLSWQSHFSPDTVNSATAARIVLDSSGTIYLGGTFRRHMLLLKFNQEGTLTDSMTVGDDSTSHSLTDFAVDKDGAVYLAGGHSYWAGSDLPNVDCAVFKAGAQGNLLWKQYLDAGSARTLRLDLLGNPVAITQDETTAKYSPDGQLLWFRNSHNSSPSIAVLTGLAIDSRNRIIVSGYGCPEECFEYMLIKYDTDGNKIWSRNYSTSDSSRDFSSGMTIDRQDNIYLTGNSAATYADSKCVTVKYDSSGNKLWDAVYSRNPAALDLGQFIAVDDSSNVYVGGYSSLSTGWDYLVIKYRQGPGGDEVTPPFTMPLRYALEQNYPNPFNPKTTISYSIPTGEFVSLKVYSLLGEVVATLVQTRVQAGSHAVQFDAGSLSSGVYFYRLQAGGFVQTKKLLVLR